MTLKSTKNDVERTNGAQLERSAGVGQMKSGESGEGGFAGRSLPSASKVPESRDYAT